MTVAVMWQHRGRSFWLALGGTLSFRGGLRRRCSNYPSTGRRSKMARDHPEQWPGTGGVGTASTTSER